MLIAIVAILSLSRGKAITPFLVPYFLVPVSQVIVLAGLHLLVHQILIVVVLVKMALSSKQRFAGGFNVLDKVVVLWALVELIALVVQWMDPQALIKGLGDLVVYLGGYLAVRFLICDREAVRRMVKALALICVVEGACMVSEQFTNQNVFAFAGAGAPTIREGHVRSEGSMGTLYSGAFAGASVPFFLWMWGDRRSRTVACAGLVGAMAMVFTSHASTSWMALGGALIGLCFWPLRRQMRLLRWGIVAALAGLHLVMHGPVWSLIEKIDLTGGSSSYHRYMLVDNCIRHFADWWLVGYKYYGNWGFDMWDLCNQFVVAALTGGLAALLLYIGIFSKSFGMIGTARKRNAGDRPQEWFLWCLGSSLLAHVLASFGINYMFSLMLYFYCLLSTISMATSKADPTRTHHTNNLRPVAEVPAEQFLMAESI
jgi:hypothetical protein